MRERSGGALILLALVAIGITAALASESQVSPPLSCPVPPSIYPSLSDAELVAGSRYSPDISRPPESDVQLTRVAYDSVVIAVQTCGNIPAPQSDPSLVFDRDETESVGGVMGFNSLREWGRISLYPQLGIGRYRVEVDNHEIGGFVIHEIKPQSCPTFDGPPDFELVKCGALYLALWHTSLVVDGAPDLVDGVIIDKTGTNLGFFVYDTYSAEVGLVLRVAFSPPTLPGPIRAQLVGLIVNGKALDAPSNGWPTTEGTVLEHDPTVR